MKFNKFSDIILSHMDDLYLELQPQYETAFFKEQYEKFQELIKNLPFEQMFEIENSVNAMEAEIIEKMFDAGFKAGVQFIISAISN